MVTSPFRTGQFFARLLGGLLLVFFAAAVANEPHTVRSPLVEQPHLEAQLLSEYEQVQPGSSFHVAVKLIPEAGWHTYWINPGDSGLATVVNWRLPAGVSAGPIIWPTAEKFDIGPLSNYGFEGDTYLLTEITVAADYAYNSLPITAFADWLVCEEICIPGSAQLSIDIAVANSPARPATSTAEEFRVARSNLPERAEWPAYFDVQGNQVTILVDSAEAAAMDNGSLYGFVGANELVEHQAPGTTTVINSGGAQQLILQRQLNTYFYEAPEQFPLLLVNNERAVQLTALAANEGMAIGAASSSAAASNLNLAWVLLLAMAGGLLLNLMPCVFPVLSLKALHLANQQQSSRADAIGYTLGVIGTFVAIAGLLIALRAGGQALGWGFQLQNPLLIAILALLFIAIALNLSGVFQIGTRIMQLGQGSHQQSSVATGVLAVVIASPCTAPFMGVALGFAIIQPPVIALTIFAALGLGMALPFLLLGFIPQVAKLLPKPGAWMNTFKQWMAIPMYLTTVWLLWVFGRQAGVDSLALLLFSAVIFATALWCFGVGQLSSRAKTRQNALALILLLITAGGLYAALSMQQTSGQSSASEGRNWQAWSPDLYNELVGQQPVFVNMTADWCITCLANERVALETTATRVLFQEYEINYLKGDWTLQNPEITDYLARYQRNGVPLYVLYWPGAEAVVLPQILTPAIIREAVERASGIEK